MKYFSLQYRLSGNVGDNIQSMAAEQFLPTVDGRIDRDFLAVEGTKEKGVVIMNGWFAQAPATAFPPNDSIIPVFFGFHISPSCASEILKPDAVDYLKRRAPIGCRDRCTCELLAKHGIEAFYSKCLTLTFPARSAQPKDGVPFIVDAQGVPVPKEMAENACWVSQGCPHALPDESKRHLAQALLLGYREKASVVVTTKLHCALPCIAMGIPVVFFGNPKDRRLEVLLDLGVQIQHYAEPSGSGNRKWFQPAFRRFGRSLYRGVDWFPKCIDIRSMQNEMRQTVTAMIRRAGNAAVT